MVFFLTFYSSFSLFWTFIRSLGGEIRRVSQSRAARNWLLVSRSSGPFQTRDSRKTWTIDWRLRPCRYKCRKKVLSIDNINLLCYRSGRKIRLKRPYSESIWEIDVEQFKTFLDFYGAPVDSAENNQEKIKTIINALTSSVTVKKKNATWPLNLIQVDQVSEEDVSFLLPRIRNVETVPKRGKGNGDYKCKICPKLLLHSDCYGLTNKENLKRHYQHHLQHHITRWKCSLCSHTHFRKDTLEQHLKRLHPCEIGEAIELWEELRNERKASIHKIYFILNK